MMKRILYHIILVIFCTSNSYSQQQIITICSEKTGCEFAKVDLSKSQIDNILDKPNFLVREKEVVILNLSGCESKIEKGTTPQQLHQKYNGKGNVLEIKNFDLRKYLLDNGCLKTCKTPLTPNAGQQANVKIGLAGNFTFNKKFSFSVKSSEGNLTSYFYLNMQNGYALMDNAAMQKMVAESYDGEVNQVMTSHSDFYQYMKSPEGNFSMKLGGKKDNLLSSSKQISNDFFKKFKKTGAKKRMYGDFDSEEYRGYEEGEEFSIWLSCSGTVAVDKKVTYSLSGFFGMGYVVNPGGETFLVTAIEGKDAKISLLNIEYCDIAFSGKNYKPMGEMMGQAISQNEVNTNSGNENQYSQAMMQQMLQSANQFGETSDIQDLPSTELLKSVDYNANFYDYIIMGFEQSRTDIQQSIADLNKNQSNYKKRLAELNCLKNCAISEKARYEKLKNQHLALLNQYKDDDEKRDQKVGSLLENFYTTTPCSCN